MAADVNVYILFYGLWKGLTVEQLTARYDISPAEAEEGVAQLSAVKLVERSKTGKLLIRAPEHIEWNDNGPLEKLYEEQMRLDFLDGSFDGPGAYRKRVGGPLSEASVAYIEKRLQQLAAEVKDLAQVDAAGQSSNSRPIYTLLLAFREWVPAMIIQKRRKSSRAS